MIFSWLDELDACSRAIASANLASADAVVVHAGKLPLSISPAAFIEEWVISGSARLRLTFSIGFEAETGLMAS
jgi:hypothetical protein